MIRRLLSPCAPLALVALISPSPLHGQIDRTELNGTLTDNTGAAVAHASVTVTQEGTNQTRQTMTNSHGQYVISSLPIGRFTIVFQREGFQDLRVADLDLHSGDTRTVNGTLEVGAVNQTISVEADLAGAQLDKSNATVGDTVQSVQVSRLPLNGRNITNLELLLPELLTPGQGLNPRFDLRATEQTITTFAWMVSMLVASFTLP